MESFFRVVAVLSCVVTLVLGHGRLINPPGRSTMWRYGYDTPRNSDDHQLSCGGFGVQFYQNGGKCGICGDRYDGPRDNEAGGKYANGIIVEKYAKGQVITVQVEITVNHGGWFEFRLCPNNNVKKAATQECLDRYLLKQVNGEERFAVPEGLGVATIVLQLPQDLTCSQCVFQWKWNTASNVRCDGSECCRGCGDQEQFYGCADVAIGAGYNTQQQEYTIPPYLGNLLTTRRVSGNNAAIPDSFVPVASGSGASSGSQGTQVSQGSQLPSGPVGVPVEELKCRANEEYSSPGWDEWCYNTCRSGDDCPATLCTEECQMLTCRAKEFFREAEGDPVAADEWCQDTCAGGFCPLEYCEKSCWVST